MTVFLFVFNAIGYLNGPEISKSANFALQIASKLHELAIVGSLTTIAIDLIRHHMLCGGINFGLLSTGQRFVSLSWLWSPDFFSGFYLSMSRWPKLLLLSTLILCCLVASTLLFLPT
ncbi:hypothetical protein K458DRAFT_127236 [Lentithecium fluviatile CBS 122367]|uniref:Uncharacterized protein n=1 Tax=Lentithecium fluviatile CBS 122367 TaxID=1168545 RepID=A0A6G1JFQ1_9PLEO|nr:hypothetical protein K458DRAFT_127236 [Lentithecium fluviatile CBS 122367]